MSPKNAMNVNLGGILLFTIWILSIQFFAFPTLTYPQNEIGGSIRPPAPNEQSYEKEKRVILDSYDKEKTGLLEEIRVLESENARLSNGLTDLEGKINGYEFVRFWIKNGIGAAKYALWFLPIMILNHFLYLFFREKPFFVRFRKWIVGAFIALEVLMLIPFVVSAAEGSSHSASQADPFEAKISEIIALIGMSPVEKAIRALENSAGKPVELPEINVGNSYLKPLGGRIYPDTFEYHYTLAALYFSSNQNEKCSGMLQAANEITPSASALKNPYLTSFYKGMLRFFQENGQMVQASNASKKIIEMYVARNDVNGLLEFSSFLSEKNLKASEELALTKLSEAASTIDQHVSIAGYLISVQRTSSAAALVESAIQRCTLVGQVEGLISFCLKNGMTDQYRKAKEKAVSMSRSTDDSIRIARLLFELKREEDGVLVLNEAKGKTTWFQDLVKISEMAQTRNHNILAAECVERILLTSPNAVDLEIEPPLSSSGEELPAKGAKVSMATYLGTLHQTNKNFESAEMAYKIAVEKDLDAFLEKNWFSGKFGGNINNFFYLRRLWLEKSPEKVILLDGLYSQLWKSSLEKLRESEENTISNLEARFESLKSEKVRLEQRIDTLRKTANEIYFDFFLTILYGIALVGFLSFLATGWTVKGLEAARKAATFKFFAFFWKFVESCGWSFVFSVIGAVAGLIAVVLSQFMEIIHKIDQNTEFENQSASVANLIPQEVPNASN